MGKGKTRLFNLAELEGKISPHQGQVKGGLGARAPALEYVTSVEELAEYLGGRVEKLEIGEDWAVSKELFPGITVYFVYNRADDEFPSRLQALYGGEKISMIHGEELATLTISAANQMLRYVRCSNPGVNLPEVCYRV